MSGEDLKDSIEGNSNSHFDIRICEMRKEVCEEKMRNLEEYIEEVDKKYEKQISTIYRALRNRILISDKNRKEDIDSLTVFLKKIKGNGDPGVFEEIRTIKRQLKGVIVVLVAVVVLMLGGTYMGISVDKLKEKMAEQKQNIEQLEKTQEVSKPTNSVNP